MACRLLGLSDMVAKDFTELIAWQRADELERFALEMIKRPRLAADKTFCEQTSDAAGSAPRNIAEGHGRFAPVPFANFLRIAIASEQETRNQIIKAWQRGAITESEKRDGLALCKRALTSAIRLRAYLQTEEAKANAKSIEARVAEDTQRARHPPGTPPNDIPPNDKPPNDKPPNDGPLNDEPPNAEPDEPLNP